jgi:hypothetical protein
MNPLLFLAQPAPMDGANAAPFILMAIVSLAIMAFYVVCGWKIFVKAGRPGWASLIPIYNTIVTIQIAGLSLWYFLLLLIPGVNFVAAVILTHKFVVAFGKDIGFTLGMLFLPFIFGPILALGDATYNPHNSLNQFDNFNAMD